MFNFKKSDYGIERKLSMDELIDLLDLLFMEKFIPGFHEYRREDGFYIKQCINDILELTNKDIENFYLKIEENRQELVLTFDFKEGVKFDKSIIRFSRQMDESIIHETKYFKDWKEVDKELTILENEKSA